MSSRGSIVVLGAMGQTPFAGMAWQVLQYLEALRRLGYDAYYVEDTGDWPYDPETNRITSDPSFTVRYLARVMNWWGGEERWAYRAASDGDRVYGGTASMLARWLREADALINLTGATVLREDHLLVPCRIYLETDPGLPQIELAEGRAFTLQLLDAHTHHFTFAANLGSPTCGLPDGSPIRYQCTRQPVIMDWWSSPPRPIVRPRFTTIGSWRQTGKDFSWQGELYTWSKHHEFLKIAELPSQIGASLEIAVPYGNGVDAESSVELTLMQERGWRIVDAFGMSGTIDRYRKYIKSSDGELTVAKDQNVRLRTGWFSDRSACYLAGAKPVITQDTGFDETLPTGRGLFSFRGLDDIRIAVDSIASNPVGHMNAAREIAREYFDAEKVVAGLLEMAALIS